MSSGQNYSFSGRVSWPELKEVGDWVLLAGGLEAVRRKLLWRGAGMLEASCFFLVNIEAPTCYLQMGFCTFTGQLTHAAASHPSPQVT